MNTNMNLLDCIDFNSYEIPDYYEDFTDSLIGLDPRRGSFKFNNLPRDFFGMESTPECSAMDSPKIKSEETDNIPELTRDESVLESANKLLKPSKKISKKRREQPKSLQKKSKQAQENPISLDNAKKLSLFFKKWKELRKKNPELRNQVKFWFSSFDLKLNKTYLYRDFFDYFRVHFRLVLRDGGLNLQTLSDADFQTLFVGLTEFLLVEVERIKETILKGKKCQVYPVWIDGLNSYTLGDLSTHIE